MCVGAGGAGGGGVWECSPAGVLVSEQRKNHLGIQQNRIHSVMLLLRKILSLRGEVDVAKGEKNPVLPSPLHCLNARKIVALGKITPLS